jgi:hypothetical protein
VQVWSSRGLLQQVLSAGHHALLSQGYYLDKQIPDPSQTWYQRRLPCSWPQRMRLKCACVWCVCRYEWVDTWKNFYLVGFEIDR